MKVNWKKVLYTLAVGVGITMFTTACSNDENSDGSGNGTDVKEQGYISMLSVLGQDAATRDYVGEDAGLVSERRVNSVRIVLYDVTTQIAEYAFNYNGTSLHQNADAQDFLGDAMLSPADFPTYTPGLNNNVITFMPKALKVEIKPYKMLVLVNASADLVNLTKAEEEFECPSTTPTTNTSGISTYARFREAKGTADKNNLTAFIGAENYNSTPAPTNFLMSNAQEYVDVLTTHIKPTETEAYTRPVTAKLDRAVAKVSLRGDLPAISSATGSKGAVSDGQWLLDVTNKTAFWMRHKAKVLGGTADETSSTPRQNYYADDTNFDLYSWLRYSFNNQATPGNVITTSPDNIKTYFNYVTTADFATNGKTVGFNSTDWTNAAITNEYALENTMAAGEQYEDVTTAVILKLKYLPFKTSLQANFNAADGYFVWAGKYVLTAPEIRAIRDYAWDATDPNYSDYLTFAGLQTYLKDNQALLEGPNGFGTNYTALTASKTVGQLTFNKDGINYYRILIRHFGDDQESKAMAYGRYGLVRNNWYRLTINSVAGPGDIKVPDPEGPDDKDQLIGVSIEVLPWVVRDQIVDVK